MGSVELRADAPLELAIMRVKPAELPEFYRSAYRLMPDRRFLYAASAVRQLISGAKLEPVSYRWDGKNWQIRVGQTAAGELPELPSFREGLDFLRRFASAGFGSGPRSRADETRSARLEASIGKAETGNVKDVLDALSALNTLWDRNAPDPGVLAAGRRALVWLALETKDDLELSDPLTGRALAVCAAAEALGRHDTGQDAALLASVMGYDTDAEEIARALDAADPVRLFLQRDPGLLKSARKADASSLTRFLCLLRLAEVNRYPEWSALLDQTSWGEPLTLPAFRAAEGLTEQGIDRLLPSARIAFTFREATGQRLVPRDETALLSLPAAARFPWRLYECSGGESRSGQTPPERQLARFEQTVDQKARLWTGPLLDGDAIRSFYRANLYTGVYGYMRFAIDSMGWQDAGKYPESIVDAPPGTASELKQWALDRVAFYRDNSAADRFAEDIISMKNIGVAPLNRIRYSAARTLTFSNPLRRKPLHAFFSRLDSRPSNLAAATYSAYDDLQDLFLMERYFRRCADLAPRALEHLLPWYVKFSRDTAWLKRVVDSPTYAPSTRSAAFQYLADADGVDVPFAARAYQEIRGLDPNNASVVWYYADFLEKKKQPGEAWRAIDDWSREHATKDVAWANLSAHGATILRHAGQLEQAWQAVRPTLEVYNEASLDEGAEICLARRDFVQAMALARRSRERYPSGANPTILIAKIFWAQGQWKEAARALAEGRARIDASDWWYTVAPAFIDVAGSREDDQIVEASRALLDANLGVALGGIADALGKKSRSSLAIRLIAMFPQDEKPESVSGTTLQFYRMIAKSAGNDAAVDWMKKRVTKYNNSLAIVIFQFGDFDLLWKLFPEPPDLHDSDVLHILRAAALVYMKEESGPRREEVVEYLKSRPATSHIAIAAAYLMGTVDEKSLFGSIHDIDDLADLGWVMGIRAAAGGDFRSADEWLEVSMETNDVLEPPNAYARGVLGGWARTEKFLPAAAREAFLKPDATQ